MALVTQQMQGSHITFPSRPVSWNNGVELKRFVTALQMVVKSDRQFPVRCKSCLSVGAPFAMGPKAKTLRVLAFQGSAQKDESGGKVSGSKSAKNSVKLSYVKEGSEEILTESPKMQNDLLSYASEADETMARSLAIQDMFKNWLTLLRTQPPNKGENEALDGPDPGKMSVVENETQIKEKGNILKAAWGYFWGLDATLKIPILAFLPCYLAVNAAYGAEVSKELAPLWVCGPLFVALYIRMVQGLRALYVFSFKQTVKLVNQLPMAYVYCLKLREDMWQSVVDMKNLDYRTFAKEKLADIKEWAVESYLDFVEFIRPYIRRFKRYIMRENFS